MIKTLFSRFHYKPGPQVLRPETNPTTNMWFTFRKCTAKAKAPIPCNIWQRRFFKRDVLVFVKSKERTS